MANKSLGKSARIPASKSNVLNSTPPLFEVGDTVLSSKGDKLLITNAYGLQRCTVPNGIELCWGYLIDFEGKNYFVRAGSLWRTDDLKPSWLRLVVDNTRAVQS